MKPQSAGKVATPQRPPWTVPFEHRGRQYSIYKREDSRSAPYQFCLVRRGKRHRQSLETNDSKTAIERARALVDKIVSDKWDEVKAVQCRRPGSVPLAKLLAVYPQVAQVSTMTLRNNLGAIKWLVEVATGKDLDPQTFSLSSLDGELIGLFQRNMVKRYQLKAPLTEPGQREARERALRSSRSVIKQARSLFAQKSGLAARYLEHGITLPESVQAFMTAPLDGRVSKREYHAPDDKVIKAAFEGIGKFRDTDRDVYVSFWFAVGAGLRRSEIRQMHWEYLVERSGATWVSGGIGKDGQKIEVPVQEKAVTALSAVRKKDGRCLSDTSLEWARRLNGWMRGLGWNTQKKMHELRAYVGSLIYRKDPMAAMKFLRHKTIRQTEQAYVRYGSSAEPPQVL
jgi:integrase